MPCDMGDGKTVSALKVFPDLLNQSYRKDEAFHERGDEKKSNLGCMASLLGAAFENPQTSLSFVQFKHDGCLSSHYTSLLERT